MEQPVTPLVSQAAVDDLAGVAGQSQPGGALIGQGLHHSGQPRGGPAIAHAPEPGVDPLSLTVVPDVGVKVSPRVPQRGPVGLDLSYRFVRLAGQGQERGGHVDRVVPQLHAVGQVAQGSARRPGGVQQVVEQTIGGGLELAPRVAGDTRRI